MQNVSSMYALVDVLSSKPWPKVPKNIPHCKFDLSEDISVQAWLSECNEEYNVLVLKWKEWDEERVSLVVCTEGEIYLASKTDAKLSVDELDSTSLGAEYIKLAVSSLIESF